MKQVLVLGAGLVARPLVRYLLDSGDIHVKIATRTVSKAERLIAGHANGSSEQLNVENEDALQKVIGQADLVISLLPWIHHMKVARLCLQLNKHMVTTSYVKPEMKALHEEAQKKGLLFLNEIGVDPGIDHMAAMRVIDGVKDNGGKITRFRSYCGGLPALQNNNNPLGYKFSWSPVGVMLAANNDGRYQEDNRVIEVSGEHLFEHYWLVDVPGAGTFEAYVNRDALIYKDLYSLQDAQTIYRGTLRNISHCESWNYFKTIGLLNQEMQFDFDQQTPAQVMAALVKGQPQTVMEDTARFLQIPVYAIAIKKLQWLGLFSDEKLPLGKASVFDMFAHILENKLVYHPGEIDLLVQHHEFEAEYDGGKREHITSTMVDTGIPHGESSMSRTVSLPAAIATRLILEGKIDLTGVWIPVHPAIYKPVLDELETMDIKLTEQAKPL
ncbi:MAG: saccharopine dehydrogenase [Caldithrix sp.]|nr:saccharopine dehydrogenase [Caldithrix sp.]